ncbi:uncharacterized protein LOC133813922 [Humulus lupulus]|uniref:uncharacterized protein LOC133813922 n=1 Tax=Humulus lupulus TaxID=3486 RepID=UPI002B402B09|nr:uncharacterized protein LOC133813922 [Humulus lupulus]
MSVYRRLGIGEVRPTTVTLQLADRSLAYPDGKIEDVLIKVDKFIFPVDFIVLDYEADREVPIILRRPFLATGRTLIAVQKGELTMRVKNEQVTFNVFKAMRFPNEVEECYVVSLVDSLASKELENNFDDPLERLLMFDSHEEDEDEYLAWLEASSQGLHTRKHFESLELSSRSFAAPKPSVEEPPELELKALPSHLRYAYLGKSSTLPLIVSAELSMEQEEKLLDVLRKFKKVIGWTIADIKGINLSLCMHKIMLENNEKGSIEGQRRLNSIMKEVVKKEIIKWLDARWRIFMDYRKLNKATRKDHFPLPFIDQMLDRLAGREYYCFLEGYSGYNQIAIAPEDQHKKTFTCPYGTFAFRRMPFGLCNAPATFQRCMMAIFTDMVEQFLEVFMDDFSIFGDSYDDCLSNLAKVLQRCEETNLVLNWEKCHFMVKEGIVLGHKISRQGIEVD